MKTLFSNTTRKCKKFTFILDIIILLFGISLILVAVYLPKYSRTLDPKRVKVINRRWFLYTKQVTNNVLQREEIFTVAISNNIILFGGFVIFTAIMGLVGKINKSQIILHVYCAVIFAKTLIMFTAIVVYFVKPDTIIDEMKETALQMVNNYISSFDPNIDSIFWTFYMMENQCCGIESGVEFLRSKKFSEKIDISGKLIKIKYPWACCSRSFNDPVLSKHYKNCPETFKKYNSNINRGCWKIFTKEMTKVLNYMSEMLLIVLSVELIAASLTAWLNG